MSQDKPLNILLITSDQQHFDTLGFANPRIQTPALDRLAREGTNFSRAYCNSPVCSPSRATIITGQYPAWHHCWTIGVKLPEDVPTVGEDFRNAGYDTSLIGKAHFQPLHSHPNGPGGKSLEAQPTLRDLDFWRNFTGPWYGFDRIELARNHGDESHVGQHYAIWMEENGLSDWRNYFDATGHEPAERYPDPQPGHWALPEAYHYTPWTGQRTIANIERAVEAGQPFFCWSSYHDPHPPYLCPEPWASMYDPADMRPGTLTPGEFDDMPPHFAMTQDPNADFSWYRSEPGGHWAHGMHPHGYDYERLQREMAIYYGMTSFMDHWIGKTLDRLDELGIAENTLVVFTTDHGHFLGQHGLTHKGPFMYEDLIRLPFLVRWPGRVPAGGHNGTLQGLVDLAPTFLAAAGLDVPGRMQGLNQLSAWANPDQPVREDLINEFRHNPTRVHLRTFVTERYKLTLYREQPYGELFDLVEDPGELRNRFDDPTYAGVKAELLQRFLDAELRREPTRMPRIAGA